MLLVGNYMIRGISGGQRKRVTKGTENTKNTICIYDMNCQSLAETTHNGQTFSFLR